MTPLPPGASASENPQGAACAKARDGNPDAEAPERDASATAGCALLVKHEEQAMLAEYEPDAVAARK